MPFFGGGSYVAILTPPNKIGLALAARNPPHLLFLPSQIIISLPLLPLNNQPIPEPMTYNSVDTNHLVVRLAARSTLHFEHVDERILVGVVRTKVRHPDLGWLADGPASVPEATFNEGRTNPVISANSVRANILLLVSTRMGPGPGV